MVFVNLINFWGIFCIYSLSVNFYGVLVEDIMKYSLLRFFVDLFGVFVLFVIFLLDFYFIVK